jgi:hypothetical protein
MTETNRLERVAAAVRSLQSERKRLNIEAEAWIEQQMEARQKNLERLILDALEEHKLVEVAEAYTISGKTPNRNAIHRIKNKYAGVAPVLDADIEYPFEWWPRIVQTARGSTTVNDVVGTLDGFGPDGVSGTFRWTYTGAALEPVLTEDDPYPNTKYYQAVLQNWLESHPYPGEE